MRASAPNNGVWEEVVLHGRVAILAALVVLVSGSSPASEHNTAFLAAPFDQHDAETSCVPQGSNGCDNIASADPQDGALQASASLSSLKRSSEARAESLVGSSVVIPSEVVLVAISWTFHVRRATVEAGVLGPRVKEWTGEQFAALTGGVEEADGSAQYWWRPIASVETGYPRLIEDESITRSSYFIGLESPVTVTGGVLGFIEGLNVGRGESSIDATLTSIRIEFFEHFPSQTGTFSECASIRIGECILDEHADEATGTMSASVIARSPREGKLPGTVSGYSFSQIETFLEIESATPSVTIEIEISVEEASAGHTGALERRLPIGWRADVSAGAGFTDMDGCDDCWVFADRVLLANSSTSRAGETAVISFTVKDAADGMVPAGRMGLYISMFAAADNNDTGSAFAQAKIRIVDVRRVG